MDITTSDVLAGGYVLLAGGSALTALAAAAGHSPRRWLKRLQGRRRDVWAAEPADLDTYVGGPRHKAWARAGLCPRCGHAQHSPNACIACYCREGA